MLNTPSQGVKNLWTTLEAFQGTEPERLCAEVKRVVEDAKPILNVSPQAVPQFTLHDAGHAQRVADRMAEIIPDYTFERLEPLECALLILSAYLHDMGMSPPRSELELYENLLFDGTTKGFEQAELETFTGYLAERWRVTETPLGRDRRDHPRPRFVEQIITDWVRINHVRRGTHIVSEHCLPKGPWRFDYMGVDYRPWLRRLCESHGEPPTALENHRSFGPEHIGQGPETCNLQYLAMVLRVADVIEFDRERAPEVLYHHQDINDWKSVSEWNKHLEVQAYWLQERQLHLTAHPSRAIYYSAIESMTRQVEDEIRACGRLARETGIPSHPPTGTDAKYIWDLRDTVLAEISEPPGSYVYIDAAFKPDTEQILKLFTGTELYSDPWAAFRELLQNAYDAVRERQARLRLRDVETGRPWKSTSLSEMVEVRFEGRDGDVYLTCTDNGVGMEKEHIEEYILRTGRGCPPGSGKLAGK